MRGVSCYIELENGKIHYLKFGSGKRLLLCFHGYANSASLFIGLTPYLAQDFTIISIDLPYHGLTKWQQSTLFHKHDLITLVRYFIDTFAVNKVALAGYSMGGRVCLTITELLPELIDRVLLIASDGLVFNPLYFFVTKTFVGRSIFRRFLSNPARYMKLVGWMRQRDWIDASRYKFAMHYLDTASDRSFLLNVWTCMSLIVPKMSHLKSVIQANNIPVFVFMGSYDRVIPVKNAQRFVDGLSSAKLFIVEKGHRVFDNDTLPQMANCLIKGTC